MGKNSQFHWLRFTYERELAYVGTVIMIQENLTLAVVNSPDYLGQELDFKTGNTALMKPLTSVHVLYFRFKFYENLHVRKIVIDIHVIL